ncbi:hypothetical protein DSL72_005711 [Monilinia vaccinii-corymbosi]|uniref:Asl1-like glycosyl hydrolase catalytic domain-containing protein n=1 Tax=Monilinia vaccinii-corymbosi TaxID=61207 RepID=A0A8A3PGE6_9HELO|nr:hypothetical protein DSL72_005711 [Monilinia vaccinii-corymbosi]
MRSFDIKSLALLALSLLVKESLAAPIYETDIRVVMEEITVTKELDGTFETGAPHAIGTLDNYGHAAPSAAPSSPALYAPAPVSSEPVAPSAPPASPALYAPAPVSSEPVAPSAPPASPALYAPAPVSSDPVVGPALYAPAQSLPVPASSVPVVAPTQAASLLKSPTVKSAVASTNTSSGKRGVAYNNADYVKSFADSSKVSWAYNWGSSSSGLSASGIEFVPLLWGLKPTFTGAWSAAASSAIASGSRHLMSFNEPDLSTQSNLGYADAAAGYKQYMQPFAGKAKLGAPAVTNGAAPMGLAWLKNFLSSCSDCTIDFVCIHWYDSASNAAYFKSYIQDAYAAGGNRPLWITEFQASGTADEQNAFMSEVLPWLDASDMVERYAWFMASTDAGGLMSGPSALSTLGKTFKTS